MYAWRCDLLHIPKFKFVIANFFYYLETCESYRRVYWPQKRIFHFSV